MDHTQTQLALAIRHRVKTIKNGPHPETQLALAIIHRMKTNTTNTIHNTESLKHERHGSNTHTHTHKAHKTNKQNNRDQLRYSRRVKATFVHELCVILEVSSVCKHLNQYYFRN